ncbi:Polyisoprenoid-binding protein YceI [Alteromonadaceae bacterium Bs31]|nr:Polyisoprenoid-binding protein YceI [Alteromonadaceae bacterium Bs31]
MRYKLSLLLFSLLSFSLLNGCGQLIKPNVKTDLAALKGGAYELDPEHSSVLFKVNHMGFSKFVGRFEQVQASLDFNPENIQQAKLHVIVDTGSIYVNNEAFELSLRGDSWLNVESFPQAEFYAEGVNKVDGSNLVFVGELTFLGVSKTIEVHATFNGGANNLLTQRYTIGFEASALFNRSDFGLNKYVPAVGDEIELEIHAEFQRK